MSNEDTGVYQDVTNQGTGGYQIYRIQDTDVYQDMTNEDGVGLSFYPSRSSRAGHSSEMRSRIFIALNRKSMNQINNLQATLDSSDEQSSTPGGPLLMLSEGGAGFCNDTTMQRCCQKGGQLALVVVMLSVDVGWTVNYSFFTAQGSDRKAAGAPAV